MSEYYLVFADFIEFKSFGVFLAFVVVVLVFFYIKIVTTNSRNYMSGLNWFLIWEKGKGQYFVSQ